MRNETYPATSSVKSGTLAEVAVSALKDNGYS